MHPLFYPFVSCGFESLNDFVSFLAMNQMRLMSSQCWMLHVASPQWILSLKGLCCTMLRSVCPFYLFISFLSSFWKFNLSPCTLSLPPFYSTACPFIQCFSFFLFWNILLFQCYHGTRCMLLNLQLCKTFFNLLLMSLY